MAADWFSNATAVVALAVSAYSVWLSRKTARQAEEAQQVKIWVELSSTKTNEWFVATLNVRNASRNDIKLEKIAVDLPDFRIARIEDAKIQTPSGEVTISTNIQPKDYYAAMSVSQSGPIRVPASEAAQIEFLLFQPAHSQKKQTSIRAMYTTLEAKPRWVTSSATAKTRSDI